MGFVFLFFLDTLQKFKLTDYSKIYKIKRRNHHQFISIRFEFMKKDSKFNDLQWFDLVKIFSSKHVRLTLPVSFSLSPPLQKPKTEQYDQTNQPHHSVWPSRLLYLWESIVYTMPELSSVGRSCGSLLGRIYCIWMLTILMVYHWPFECLIQK